MDKDERQWIEEAIDLVKRATEHGITILLVRGQNVNNLQDVVITNQTDAEVIKALVTATTNTGVRNDDEL
jgi:hypothetical protein